MKSDVRGKKKVATITLKRESIRWKRRLQAPSLRNIPNRSLPFPCDFAIAFFHQQSVGSHRYGCCVQSFSKCKNHEWTKKLNCVIFVLHLSLGNKAHISSDFNTGRGVDHLSSRWFWVSSQGVWLFAFKFLLTFSSHLQYRFHLLKLLNKVALWKLSLMQDSVWEKIQLLNKYLSGSKLWLGVLDSWRRFKHNRNF